MRIKSPSDHKALIYCILKGKRISSYIWATGGLPITWQQVLISGYQSNGKKGILLSDGILHGILTIWNRINFVRIIKHAKMKTEALKREAIISLFVTFFVAITINSAGQVKDHAGKESINSLSKKEQNEGWKLLFDGTSSKGWINAKTGRFPAGGWEISDGALTVNPATKGSDGGGDIVTVEKFRSFELVIDFRYTKGANSGIKYFIDTEKENGTQASIGCEYQVLDDLNHPDAKAGFEGNRKLAGLYDLIAPVNVKDNGFDNWNTARIIVRGNKVQHWLNGTMTVEYERGSEKWNELVAKSKFKTTKGFANATEGRILLQDHGNVVSFRNIRIRELKDL
jgi:hypothetical protein